MALQSQSVPPKIPAKIGPAHFTVATLLFAGVGAAAFLFLFNPSKHNFYPVCQFHQLTGLYCPGCGATRASYQILHGNFLAAVRDNALYVATLVAQAVRGVWFLGRKISRQSVRYFLPPAILWCYLALALLFSILRNLPAFSFLAPR